MTGESKRSIRVAIDIAVICVAAILAIALFPEDWFHSGADMLKWFAPITAAIVGLVDMVYPQMKRWRQDRQPPRAGCAGSKRIMKAWRTSLKSVRDDRARNLLAAFLATYADAEIAAIQGTLTEEEGGTTSGRRHVVTSFLTYSDLVTAVVAQAKKEYAGEQIVCFTTLPMSLSRWFNYHTKLGDERVSSIEVDDKWEHYKRTIQKLLAENDIDFRRCLIATSTAHAALTDLAIKTEADVRKQANYSILVPHEGNESTPTPKDWAKLKPSRRGDLASLLAGGNSDLETLRAEFDSAYGNRRDKYGAYLIHEKKCDDLPLVPKHIWQPLWLAFEQSAHRLPSECRFRSFDETDFREWFACDTANQVPEDVFGIGVKGESENPDWKFFFAGDVGREVARVTLEFVVAGEQQPGHRYDRLKRFANLIWNSEELGKALSSP